jgi:hypothetical protein
MDTQIERWLRRMTVGIAGGVLLLAIVVGTMVYDRIAASMAQKAAEERMITAEFERTAWRGKDGKIVFPETQRKQFDDRLKAALKSP